MERKNIGKLFIENNELKSASASFKIKHCTTVDLELELTGKYKCCCCNQNIIWLRIKNNSNIKAKNIELITNIVPCPYEICTKLKLIKNNCNKLFYLIGDLEPKSEMDFYFKIRTYFNISSALFIIKTDELNKNNTNHFCHINI